MTGADADAARKKATDIFNTFRRYQEVEYGAAIARSRTAKQWTDFNADPVRNTLYPNLRWLPSRSVNQREEHQVFYNRVWAKTDPFWTQHQPGNLWNCKCDWEETDEEPTGGRAGEATPARGLEGNPAETGEIFTDSASYIQQVEKTVDPEIFLEKNAPNIRKVRKHPHDTWEIGYFTEKEGMAVIERKRTQRGKINEIEIDKYNKERSQCLTLAKGGHVVEFLKEVEGRHDIILDGEPADLKKTGSHNHIVDSVKHAVKKQGAKIVVFEFEKITRKIVEELYFLKSENYKIIYYVSGSNKLHYINTAPRQ
jgi:hypothetical protein